MAESAKLYLTPALKRELRLFIARPSQTGQFWAITNTHARERNHEASALLVACEDGAGGGWDIVSSVALAEEVEGILLVLRMRRVEGLQKVVHVTRHFLFAVVVVAVRVTIRKPGARGLINEEQARV